MQLHFMGHSYTRCDQTRSVPQVRFSGHFLGTAYNGPYKEQSHIIQDEIELKFRGKAYKQ